ncbi:MAG TPA: CRTAC1 family protein [Verrucomicrobiae bacterium]|nr:CRTAC1 family protein [Verrucomicrobiae bacterium]
MGNSKRSKRQGRASAQGKTDDLSPKPVAKQKRARGRFLAIGFFVAVGTAFGVGFAINSFQQDATFTKSSNPIESARNDGAESADSAADAEQTMGGGDRLKEEFKGPEVFSAKVANGLRADSPATPVTEGLISLDPVCARIEVTPRFHPGNPAPSTRRMAQRLDEIRAKANPASAGYFSDRLAEMLKHQMTNASAVNEKFGLQFKLGVQQINAGRPDSALNTFSEMERLVAEAGGWLDERSRAELRLRKAMAFFRLGEQENCLATHNADSCIFPLKPKAFHLLPRGSRGAVALFNAHLAEHPKDLSARWLLNLAHMTLGEYPDKVNPEYLIPPQTFASEFDMPQFPDVSDGLGIDVNDLAGGCIVDDFDNDGFYDLVISAWDMNGQLRFFHNKGDGTFVDRTSEAGLVGEVGSLNIQQTDYNNDGRLDIWALRGAWLGEGGRIPNSLLRNNGHGTFTDVTEEAGLLSFRSTQASRWFDYDGDGWLDVFIGNESTDPKRPQWCELFHNNRDGTFTECARVSGINVAAFVKGVACADYDNDGRPDLYLSIRGERRKVLLHNDGPDASGQWRFSDRATLAKVDNTITSFATFFFDYDNDGSEDLVIFGYHIDDVGDVAADYLGWPTTGKKPILYHNNGDGTFTDVTKEARLNRICHTMGHNYGDLDNDGWLDFYCGTGDPDFRTLIPNRMFRNANGKFFQDVTTATGTGHIQKGHGVSFADFDDDGDQDVYSALGGAYSGDYARNALFMNPGTTNQWLKLKLVGTKANRAGIGARIKVALQTPNGPRFLFRTLSSGGNFGSNPLRQEIGLADATQITSVEIRWPGSNTRQILTGLEFNRSYEIREGDPTPVTLKLHPTKLDRHAPAAHGVNLQAKQ